MIDRTCSYGIVFTAAVCVALSASAATAQTTHFGATLDATSENDSGVQSNAESEKDKLIRKLRRRIKELENKVGKSKKTSDSDSSRKAKIHVLLESMYYGPRYYSSRGPRYFAAKLLLVNLTSENVTLKRENISLRAGNKTHHIKDSDDQSKYANIYIGQERLTLGKLTTPPQLSVKAGGTTSTWVLFSGLTTDQDVPEMTLQLQFDGKQADGKQMTVSVNELARNLLGLNVERIGPRGSLGLLTISGQLNTVNIQSLIDDIDKLTRAESKVLRFVVRWTKSADALNSRLQSWIRNEAKNAGRDKSNSYSNYPYPDFPGTIRELHLAQFPGGNSSTSARSNVPNAPGMPSPFGSSASTPKRVHKTDVDAVNAALKTAYKVLPRDELIKEIEQGHPLTRAAALANGGGRLPAEKLPLIFNYVDDKTKPRLQQAALTALRHFGEKAALDKLTSIARQHSNPLSRYAVASLAASRFPAAHRRLLSILKSEPAESKRKIVSILAAYPRPLWSKTLYEFARNPASGVGPAALHALGAVGHPKLLDVLKTSLTSDDAAVRSEAFRQLLAMRDDRSEEILTDYALESLKTSPPSSQILSLLNQTKDPRAVPLLLKHLDSSDVNESNIINTLARIGDQSVGEELAKRYAKLESSSDKAAVLRALIKLKYPRFRKLAAEALMSRNSSLINVACDGLRADAGPEAVRLLIHTLENSTYSSAWSYITSSLAQIGTEEARRALVRVRDDGKAKDSKRRYAVNALKSLRQRSPGYQYVQRAWQSLKQKKYDEAVDYCRLALKLDADHPWAMSCRGHVHLRRGKIEAARQDFERALKDDPHDPYAVTGMALLLATKGDHEKAVKLIEKRRDDFKNDRAFPYHAARVYVRAMQAVQTAKPTPKRKQLVAKYRKQALADLQRAVKLGQNYSNGYKKAHAQSDSDFAPLRTHAEYQKLIGPAPKKTVTGEEAREKLIEKKVD